MHAVAIMEFNCFIAMIKCCVCFFSPSELMIECAIGCIIKHKWNNPEKDLAATHYSKECKTIKKWLDFWWSQHSHWNDQVKEQKNTAMRYHNGYEKKQKQKTKNRSRSDRQWETLIERERQKIKGKLLYRWRGCKKYMKVATKDAWLILPIVCHY